MVIGSTQPSPNVDKASMVRWRQAEVHRQRRIRKDKLEALGKETNINAKAVAALETLSASPEASSIGTLLTHLEKLRADFAEWTNTLKKEVWEAQFLDRHPRWAPPEPEEFVEKRVQLGDLVAGIIAKLSGLSDDAQREHVVRVLEEEVKAAVETIWKRQKEVDLEVKKEHEEAEKKLTSDQLHEGFNKTVLTKNKPPPEGGSGIQRKEKEKVIETIHDPSSKPAQSAPASEEEDDEADYITYAPAEAFAKISDMDESYKYLGEHPELATQKYSDEILAEAFRQQMDGNEKLAKCCVTQGLLLQLRAPAPNARDMFYKDVEDTYDRIAKRVQVLAQERFEKEIAERELLERRLELARQEDGTLKLPIPQDATEEDRKRAAVFDELPHQFQGAYAAFRGTQVCKIGLNNLLNVRIAPSGNAEALLMGDADKINAFLGSVSKEEAERVVKKCAEVNLLELEVEETEGGPDESS
ncbi:hsp90 co-chaperone Cdc37 [Borealophlyctis nickersoniae]|nr:hsp90 co-chaperone Cdc37 [Borealophlyctis nickersoniae]